MIPKLSSLEQHTPIITQFLWAGNVDAACIFCFRVSHTAALKILAKTEILSEGSTRAGSAFKLTYVTFGRIRFLKGCWAEGLSPLLDGGCPQHFAVLASPAWQLASTKHAVETESSGKIGIAVFCNLIMEMISPQCCHILLVRSKLLREKGLHKAMKTKR